MQKAGKISVKHLKTLITGSSCRLGDALTRHLVKQGSTVYTVDENVRTTERYGENHHFQQGNLADESFFRKYLQQIEPIDALVNCAGFRSSYNYYLTYMISKNILEKFKQNEINEFGCRGCIVNLVYTGSKYTDEYFKEQEDFIRKYKISNETIDDEVYCLADLLTAARIRCNTVMVDPKLEEQTFVSLVTHIIEDQYVAGQVINLEDNLRHRDLSKEEFRAEVTRTKKKQQTGDQKYYPPPEIEEAEKSETPVLSLPSSPPPIKV